MNEINCIFGIILAVLVVWPIVSIAMRNRRSRKQADKWIEEWGRRE